MKLSEDAGAFSPAVLHHLRVTEQKLVDPQAHAARDGDCLADALDAGEVTGQVPGGGARPPASFTATGRLESRRLGLLQLLNPALRGIALSHRGQREITLSRAGLDRHRAWPCRQHQRST